MEDLVIYKRKKYGHWPFAAAYNLVQMPTVINSRSWIFATAYIRHKFKIQIPAFPFCLKTSAANSTMFSDFSPNHCGSLCICNKSRSKYFFQLSIYVAFLIMISLHIGEKWKSCYFKSAITISSLRRFESVLKTLPLMDSVVK